MAPGTESSPETPAEASEPSAVARVSWFGLSIVWLTLKVLLILALSNSTRMPFVYERF